MQDKTCIITGGFGFLGRKAAEISVQKGYNVALLDIHDAPDEDTEKSFGPDILVLGGVDISNPHSATEATNRINSHFGRIDVLLNIAGGFRWETIEEGQPESWEALHKMNVMTCLNMARAVLPYMKTNKTGYIVNIGAAAAVKSTTGMGAYAASKSAVHRLTESLAEEVKDYGITVNAVLPSIIDTPLNRADMPDEDFSKWVRPQDLMEIILFLASDKGNPITGALLPVTGKC